MLSLEENKVAELIRNVLPKEIEITKVEFLGPDIVIYTKTPEEFYKQDTYVSKIAGVLKKRVNIRADKTVLMEIGQAKKEILSLIPEDAQVSTIIFDVYFSEVIIEALKPGLVIGKGGSTTKAIINKTKWTPNILRAPMMKSKLLPQIRKEYYGDGKERKQFLKEVSKNIYAPKSSHKEWVRACFFGGFREVGRSCILFETANSKIMLDCGINAAVTDEPYPLLETIGYSLSEISAVIVSHAHLDHSGFVPYLFKAGYRGPVYCTAATRDVMYTLQKDYMDVILKEGKIPPYSEKDINEMLKHVITREYGEVTDVSPDIRITLYNAAHILGSSSVHIHVGDGLHNMVYSGDIKFGFTRLFNPPEINYPRVESLIIESTYGGEQAPMPKRQDAEMELINTINKVIERGGNVLIPVFAVGRSQEVMLVLEHYYKAGQLKAKTVYIDGLIKEINAIHTAYPESLRETVQKRILTNNSPFSCELFKEVESRDDRESLVAQKGNIFLATSGMMTGGPSVEYFTRMAQDEKSAILFVGWQGEGSLGRKLQNGTKVMALVDVVDSKLKKININMEVCTVEGFSGHCDRSQLLAYIRNLSNPPKKIIVNHGEREGSVDFAKFVSSKYRINSSAPKNLECVRLH